MTSGRKVLAGLVVCACLAHAAEPPPIEFSGVLTSDGKTQLALTDKATNSTQWVEAGGEFNGYTIARYDAKEDAIFVSRGGGEEQRIGLEAPKSPLPPSGTAAPTLAASTGGALGGRARTSTALSTDAAASAIRSNLRLLASAARQYQTERGAATVAYSDLVGPGKFISELRPVAGENYSTLTFAPGATSVAVTLPDGARVSLDLTAASSPSVASTPPATASPPATPAPAPTAQDALAPTGRTTPPPADSTPR